MDEFECNGCDDFCILKTSSEAPKYCPKSGNPCDQWEEVWTMDEKTMFKDWLLKEVNSLRNEWHNALDVFKKDFDIGKAIGHIKAYDDIIRLLK